jgi:hypothetical protein
VQELSFASKAFCICEKLIIDYYKLNAVFVSILKSGHDYKLTVDDSTDKGFSQILNIRSIQESVQACTPDKLTTLLGINRQQLATDPRDKVFALLDLSADIQTSVYQPDYSQAVDEIYKRIAVLCLEKQNSYDLLSLASNFDQNAENRQSPSWVLDRVGSLDVQLPFNIEYPDTFHAAAKTTTSCFYAREWS